MNKDIVISGVKPSGTPHLGTLCGVVFPFRTYQEEYDLNIFIADIHALTLPIDPQLLKKHTNDLIKLYLCYLDPNKVNIFKQSDIPAHAQLSQIVTCQLDVSDLTKMPQYKNFCVQNKGKAVPAGMLDYVNWMNADILAYSPPIESNRKLKVIVGVDQLPHIYSCTDVANRFNKRYGETFKIPEPIISKTGAKIMSLSDPTKKMSKSESDKGTIYLSDSSDVIYEKIKRAKTDGENKIYFDPENKPGISNLLTIYAVLRGWTIEETSEYFKDWDYGKFKNEVAAAVVFELSTLQQKMKELEATPYLIDQVLNKGAERAKEIAGLTLGRVYKKIGIQ